MDNINIKKCDICDNPDVQLVKKIKCKSVDLSLVKCKKCSLVFLNPRLIDDFYIDLYKKNNLKNANYYNLTSDEDEISFKKRLELVFNYKHKIQSVLDIGCSTGTFLEVCQKYEIPIIHGVELNQKSKEIAQKKGFRVFGELRFIERKYDLINLSDVLEHFLDPKNKLKKIISFLNKDGIIIITTPDYNKLITRLTNIKPEEHLFYYTKKTMLDLMKKLNVEVCYTNNTTRFHPLNKFLYSSTLKKKPIRFIIRAILFLKLESIINELILKRLNNDLIIIAKKKQL